MSAEHILEVRGLTRTFAGENGSKICAVDAVSFSVARGEIFGLVGESGSGKSTVARCVAGLDTPDCGETTFLGERRAIVLQDAPSSLNPRMTIREIVTEPLDVSRSYSRAQRREAALEAMCAAGLDETFAARYPSELSGGQQQRAAIARALVTRPELLIADEPLSGLDAPLKARLAALFLRLCRERGMALLLISHDLSAVKDICSHIGVMREGRLIECADARTLCKAPKHEYTKALLDAILLPDPGLYTK